MAIRTRLVVCLFAAGVAASIGAPALAQDAADPQFAALADKLRRGDKVAVTGLDGGVVKGRLAALSPEAITVLVDGDTRVLPATGVTRVRRTRTGVLLGAIIGGGAGVAMGAALASWFGNEGGNTTAAFLFPVAVGLGAGIGIDALLNLPRTVYKRQPGARVTAAPVVGAGRRGAAVRVEF